ncbi:hypothetical protein OZN62_00795 [Aurantiacibacter sp. MUD11]|uniref:hypothetical protein n=1 Tax=Aurantiacibacter sp. MUD11 TaxID=3003265 RepID=UPI0022AA3754|nr:hypothetical protein [Aurantiacibacter sp. MUD11]WAT18148.1 hypothetical protein OZN62_00795 [Aurantiacibacter sp. MUD11]
MGTHRSATGLNFLTAAGALGVVTHLVFSPQLDPGTSFGVFAASEAFFWRLSLAIGVTFLLLCGLAAQFRSLFDRMGRWGKATLMLAFAGTAVTFAHEWGQIFFLREVALVAPQALDTLEDQAGFNLFDLESAIAASLFMLGWVAFVIALWRSRVVARRGPLLVLAGFVLIPVLTLALPGLWGAALGNAVLCAGWMVLGYDLTGVAEE